MGALKLSFLSVILAVMFADLFDSLATFVGVAEATKMMDENGEPKNLKEGLIVDAIATLGGSLLGTSSGTAYIESAAGIEAGGRTGFSAVVTAVCFLPCIFIGPLVQVIPDFATAPILVLVGALMFRGITSLNLHQLEDAIPVFLTIILIPLTFSINQGLLWGFISYTLLYLLSGRAREIDSVMYLISIASAIILMVEN